VGAPAEEGGLREYLHVIWRRKWLVAALVLAAVASAYAVSASQPAEYQAQAQVIVTRQDLLAAVTGQQSANDAAQADRLVQTMAELARVPTLAQRTLAAARVHSLTAGQFLAASSVTPSTSADVITFAVTEHDQALAARLSTAYAQQFRLYRHQLDTTSLNQAQAKVARELRRLGRAGRAQTALYGYLLGKSEQLQSLQAVQGSNGYVVHPAGTAAQVQPRPVRNAAVAAVVGLLLGIALAFLWETLDTRVRSVDDVRELLGLRVLARIPTFQRNQEPLVMLTDPRSAEAETFRTLRMNLDLANAQRRAKTIMVASALDEEGKSTILANLAVALARAGRSVAAVDCDLHGPSLHRLFSVSRSPGLAEVLVGDVSVDDALRGVAIAGRPSGGESTTTNGSGAVAGVVQVMSGGGALVEDELVAGEAIGGLLRDLESRFDYVLVDTPPLLEFSDGLGVSAHADGAIVVVRLEVSRRTALEELQRVLAGLPVEPLGMVVNGADGPAGGYYGRDRYGRTPAEAPAGR
jgi:Mrp family chromosome partitioning ATPase